MRSAYVNGPGGLPASQFILLDRDGVINQRIVDGYVTSWEQFIFLPGALDALRLLATHAYSTVVVSNQACVGKGLITLEELDAINQRFIREVERNGGRIDGVYCCPHHPDAGCDCRKPEPGLLHKAQEKHGFVFGETFLVGDSETDLLAARSVGCPALLISEYGRATLEELRYGPFGVFSSLHAATEFLVDCESRF